VTLSEARRRLDDVRALHGQARALGLEFVASGLRQHAAAIESRGEVHLAAMARREAANLQREAEAAA
jgi:hypothetical protein